MGQACRRDTRGTSSHIRDGYARSLASYLRSAAEEGGRLHISSRQHSSGSSRAPRLGRVPHLLILVLLMVLLVPLLPLREYLKRYRQCLKRIMVMAYPFVDASPPWWQRIAGRRFRPHCSPKGATRTKTKHTGADDDNTAITCTPDSAITVAHIAIHHIAHYCRGREGPLVLLCCAALSLPIATSVSIIVRHIARYIPRN